MIIKVSREEAEARWYTDATNTDLERLWGVNKHQLWAIKKHYGLPGRTINRTKVASDPDEATIRAMCAAIRAGWSEEERLRRAVGKAREPWTAPAFKVNRRGVFAGLR